MAEEEIEWIGTEKTKVALLAEQRAFLNSLDDDERESREAGTFFTAMEDLWGTDETSLIEAEDFEVIRRKHEQAKAYELCFMYIDDNSEKIGKGSRSARTNTACNEAKADAYGNYGCDSAHLFSHAQVCHKAFGFLAEACVGRQVEAATTKTGRVAKKAKIYGDRTDAQKRLMILNGTSKKDNTALKSHRYNKMYLKDQGDLYDTENPSIIVIPLLPLDAVLDWAKEGNQEPYEILTLTCRGGEAVPISSQVMKCARGQCSPHEIEAARSLLVTFVKGVAGSLKKNTVLESFSEEELKSPQNVSLLRWRQLVDRIQGGTQQHVTIPESLDNLPDNFHVAKARLSTGNSLPDPWLVMVKAAINYSASNDMKLMPACQSPVFYDGPPNTDQVVDWETKDDSVDHAALLEKSMFSGGKTVEMYCDGDPYGDLRGRKPY